MVIVERRAYWLYIASQAVLLAGAVAVVVLTYRPDDWQPWQLFILLLLLSAIGERFEITMGNQSLSAGFIALVLAMTLLGPAPAAAIGCVAIVVDSLHRRPAPVYCFTNLAVYVVYLVAGSLLARVLIGANTHSPAGQSAIKSPEFAFAVFGVFIVANLLNFLEIAIQQRVLTGRSIWTQARSLLVPMLPGQFAAAILAAILAAAYTNLGYSMLLGIVIVIIIYQYLAVALLRSEDRAEQLETRSMHLASLQLGVLVTLVETLSLRDRAAAKHAASVARYARALAKEVGCSEEEQDVVHTASLLHDIGKFALPDRILHAEPLSDADWAAIRRHPQDGATLVGRLDGYGPVADIILYHHEHVDGSGYPVGLIGNEIPLLARVLAVCNIYDTLTSRDSYRGAMTPQDAIVELRRVADSELDAKLVRSFVSLLEREGPVEFTERADTSFEAELAFERRTQALAAPAAR